MLRFLMYFIILLGILQQGAQAHEVRPAALEIEQSADNSIDVTWKLPITNGQKLRLFPILPKQCKLPESSEQNIIDGIIVETWQSKCALDSGSISISGLENVLTDVFVRIKRPNQDELISILRPSDNILDLSQAQGAPFGEYIGIGAQHMLFGWDHLLFVLALLLIVSRRQILWVISAFTIGHSITLGVTALGLISLPSGPVELLIALSIFFLGIEAMRKLNGGSSLTIEYPWAVAAAFGLLHGLGFAGALSDIGLPKGQEIWALALFNIGIELGQILFITAAAIFYWLLCKWPFFTQKITERRFNMILIYSIAALGAYFTLTRIF